MPLHEYLWREMVAAWRSAVVARRKVRVMKAVMSAFRSCGAGAPGKAARKSDANSVVLSIAVSVVDAVFAVGRGAAHKRRAAATNEKATQKSEKIPLKLFIA